MTETPLPVDPDTSHDNDQIDHDEYMRMKYGEVIAERKLDFLRDQEQINNIVNHIRSLDPSGGQFAYLVKSHALCRLNQAHQIEIARFLGLLDQFEEDIPENITVMMEGIKADYSNMIPKAYSIEVRQKPEPTQAEQE